MSNEVNSMGLNAEESGVVAILFISFLACIALYLWYDDVWVFLKICEIKFILFFDFLLKENYMKQMTVYLYKLQRLNPDLVTFKQMMKVDSHIQYTIGWIYSFLMLYYGAKIAFRSEYKTKHDMESLIRDQTKYWRFNRHLLKFNPAKESLDITEGVYAIRKRPHVFAFDNELLDKVEADDFSEIYTLNKEKAKKVFEQQYGDVFSGYENMTREQRWLVAVFLLFAHEQESSCWDLLGDISYSYNDENPICLDKRNLINKDLAVKKAKGEWGKLFARIRVSFIGIPYNAIYMFCFYVRKYFYSFYHLIDKDIYFKLADVKADAVIVSLGETDISQKAKNSHFYCYGVLRSLLKQAHNFGVLATGRFNWLKKHNRTLWLMLSEEGMLETSVECAYPRTHYEIELQVGRKLYQPQGWRYIDAFEIFLAEKNLLKKVEVSQGE